MKKSYNGYFWIRYVIAEATVDEDGIWPEVRMIEPVQIMYEWSTEDNDTKIRGSDSSLLENHDRMCTKIGDKTIYLDNPADVVGIEWQLVSPPMDISPNDC